MTLDCVHINTDIVFGLLSLLEFSYRPQLADLPDQKLWRIDAKADYGPLNTAARGRVDLEAIRRHWPDILRITASIHTCTVRAHDVLRAISRDGHPTPLGNAIAAYGRVFKSLHVLTFIDDADYRRDIKAMRNLQESRHDLGRTSSTARRASCGRSTTRGWNTSSARSAWS